MGQCTVETPIRYLPRTKEAEFPHAPRFLPLRLVCKHWDTVIRSYQPFWSCIQSLKGSVRWLDLCLQRSGQSPLTVRKYLVGMGGCREAFLWRVTSHMHRAEELEVVSRWNTDHGQPLVSALLGGCTNSLTTLRILDHTSSQREGWETTSIDVAPVLGPHLSGIQTLELDGLPIPNPNTIPFTGLRRLSIKSALGFVNPLLSILSICPTLSQVEFHHPPSENTRIRLRFDFDEASRDVEAPSLNYLKLSGLPPRATAIILKQIRAPQLRTLVLGYDASSDGMEEHGVREALDHLALGLVTGIEVFPHGEVLFTTLRSVIFISRGGGVGHWASFFQWISLRIASSLPVTLHDNRSELKDFLAWLHAARLPVSQLRLVDSPANVKAVRELLQFPEEASEITAQRVNRPFPSLQTVSFFPTTSAPREPLQSAPPGIELLQEEWSTRQAWVSSSYTIRGSDIDEALDLLRILGYA